MDDPAAPRSDRERTEEASDREVSRVERMQALLQRAHQEARSAQSAEKAARERLEDLQRQLAEITTLNRRLAEANAETAELMATLEERNGHLKQANQQLARANAYAAELVALVETKEEEIHRLNRALAAANAQAAELVADREFRMEELERLNRRLAEEVQQRRRAQEEAADLAERLRLANQDLDRLATLDPLTDLYNRRGLERLLDAELNRSARTGDPIGVLFADFDDFKAINARFGHAGGDAALRESGRRLRRSLRPTDIVARIGGDEFLAILPCVQEQELGHLAQRFLESVSSEPVTLDGQRVFLTISVAAGILPPDVTEIEQVLGWARGALEQSKRQGKNRFTSIPR